MSTTSRHDPNSLMGHLIELRNRLLKSIAAIIVMFLVLVYWANDIYHLLALPLIQTLPSGTTMIATGVASTFFVPFKLTFIVAFFITIPYVLYQIWSFIAPALYTKEKHLIAPLIISSTLLFYSGIAFAYFLVLPVVFGFFTSITPTGVVNAPDIATYLDFVLQMFFAFGLSFEIPVAVLLLVWTGAIDKATLIEKRPYFIVVAFIIAMFLTPPDVLSQVMLAVPMCLLYELGIWMSRFYQRDTDDDDTTEQQESEPQPPAKL